VSHSLRLLIAVVIGALIVDAWLSYRNINVLLSQERAMSVSYLRLDTLQRTLSAITDAETGQRGFLLTGDEEYLAPYADARRALETDLRQLRQLWPAAADSADHDALEHLVESKLRELQQTIDLRRRGRLTAAESIVRGGQGKSQMAGIRTLIDTLRSNEEARLRTATIVSARSRQTSFSTAAFASGIAVAAVLLCVWLLRRDLEQRSRVAEDRAGLLRREQEARSQAETANRLKDDFLATLSHELRNPLHAVVGWLQILRHRPDDEALQARALETVERNARALQRMIEDLLDASRASRGKLELTLAPTAVETLVTSVLETLRPSAASKDVKIMQHVAAGGLVVNGDYDRLAQVVINLVSNAIKFTPEGGRIEVSLWEEPDAVVIAVKDTGRGITPEALPQIFEAFRQPGPRVPGTEGGLGLGLAVAKHIVELHHGTIDASSEGPGRGASFVVRLPPATAAAAREADAVGQDARS
jgi:signal transduction histidine kinase